MATNHRSQSQLNLPPAPVERVRTPTQATTDSLRSWRELVRRAMGRAGLSAKAMAGTMGITEQQLSDQLNGRENYHLSMWRLGHMDAAFWKELVDLICEFYGICTSVSPQDQEDMRIGRLVREAVQRSLQR